MPEDLGTQLGVPWHRAATSSVRAQELGAAWVSKWVGSALACEGGPAFLLGLCL